MDKPFHTITNDEIYKTICSIKDNQDKMQDVQNSILEQTRKTNGRVTKLEDVTTVLVTSTLAIAKNTENIEFLKVNSVGIWIRNHPFKFTGIIITLLSFGVSEIRNPIVEAIIKLFL